MNEKVKDVAIYHSRIKDWPEDERPREKLIKFGPRYLSDSELLALLIGSGSSGITAVDMAKKLLKDKQNLMNLAASGIVELTRMKGIGSARGARILAAIELGRRIEKGSDEDRIRVKSPEEVVKHQLPEFRGLKKELFKVILLDSGNRIIRDVTITQGTLNASIVHPREVFKAAVDYLAAGIIIIHNHPSGEPIPSKEDRQVTLQLVQSGQIMGIPVLDHIIIAGSRFFSFSKEGLLKL